MVRPVIQDFCRGQPVPFHLTQQVTHMSFSRSLMGLKQKSAFQSSKSAPRYETAGCTLLIPPSKP